LTILTFKGKGLKMNPKQVSQKLVSLLTIIFILITQPVAAQGLGGFGIGHGSSLKNTAKATALRTTLRGAINCARMNVDEIVITVMEVVSTGGYTITSAADSIINIAGCGAAKGKKVDDLLRKICDATKAQKRAAKAAQGLKKGAAASVHGGKGLTMTKSGWSTHKDFISKIKNAPIWHKVMQEAQNMGFKFEPHANDTRKIYSLTTSKGKKISFPGRYHATHAEVKMSILKPNKPIGVSKGMCKECKRWFKSLARHRKQTQIVVDPEKIRLFLSRPVNRQTMRAFSNKGC